MSLSAPFTAFSGLLFNHGHDVIEAALEAGRPVTVKFLRDKKSWKVMVGVDDGLRRTEIDFSRGALGIDLHAGHVSAALVDADGNPRQVFNFTCVTYGKSSHQASGRRPSRPGRGNNPSSRRATTLVGRSGLPRHGPLAKAGRYR